MSKYNENALDLWKHLSWQTCYSNLYRLQGRVFKSMLLGDTRTVLQVQKLIVRSNSARFLAIREVTQLNASKKISGIDGKTSLSFTERFELNEYLRLNANNWKPQTLKSIPRLRKDGTTEFIKVATIADRTWQCLVRFTLEPIHEAQITPYSCSLRQSYSCFDLQKLLFLNLNAKAFGIQKRIVEVNLRECFGLVDHNLLMRKIIAPRGIKLGLFRTLNTGFVPSFSEHNSFSSTDLRSLLADITLTGIDRIHPCVRYEDTLIFLLKPSDNERIIMAKLNNFLLDLNFDVSLKRVRLTSTLNGFNFLGWFFRVCSSGNFRCTPSVENYKMFRKKVKHIVNNSNYGSKVKATKLSPLVKNWRFYHRFCNMEGSRNSLFYMQRRAFQVFNKEAKQDRYSSKKLLDKAFPTLRRVDHNIAITGLENSPYSGHLTYNVSMDDPSFRVNHNSRLFLLWPRHNKCIHCGIVTSG